MKLSAFELEVMRLVWRDQKVIAPDIHRELAQDRDITYSTVKTIIDRLEEKGAIERLRTYGRTILYGPTINESVLAQPMVKDLVRKLFGGKARPMINHLLHDEDLTLDDLAYLEKTISEVRRELKIKGGD